MKYYKALTADNKGPYSNFDFTKYLPKGKRPGKWLPVVKNLEVCQAGYHCCKASDLLDWIKDNAYEVEIRGKKITSDNKICAEQMRFTKKVMGEYDLRVFACDCADHVLHFFEDKYPNDKRPREAIEAGRKFAKGEISAAAWNAAWNAARDAARDAAGDAAGAAAWAAARDAAGAAAGAATGAAAWAAAGDAAGAAAWAAARDAAWNAARDAAWNAAGAAAGFAAGAAARAAEKKWQLARLKQYLVGKVK
jgi:hypothetical protein